MATAAKAEKDNLDDLLDNPLEIGTKISLPDNLVPKAIDREKLPKQSYWVGTCHNDAFHATRIAGYEFPGTSFENPPGRGPTNHKVGTMLMLTEDEVKMIQIKSVQVGWRHKIVTRKFGTGKNAKIVTVSDKWNKIHYDVANPPMAGDKLTANFVFMRKLKPGQRIPLGLFDSDGEPLPTPEPMRG